MTKYIDSGFENSGGSDTTDGGVWTNDIAGSGSALAVVTSPKKSGLYALKCTLSTVDNASAYDYKTLASGYTHLFERLYFYIDALPSTDGAILSVADLLDSVPNADLVNLVLRNMGGTVYWDLNYFTNTTQVDIQSVTPTPTINTLYYIEIEYLQGSSSNGAVRAWISPDGTNILQGNPTLEATGITNDGYGNAQMCIAGIFHRNLNYAVNAYVDDVAVADTWNGMVSATASVAKKNHIFSRGRRNFRMHSGVLRF
jgi:hypothetical protein